MRPTILLAAFCLCAPAVAAPVPKELRKVPVENEVKPSVRLLMAKLIAEIEADRIRAMPPPLFGTEPVNGTTPEK